MITITRFLYLTFERNLIIDKDREKILKILEEDQELFSFLENDYYKNMLQNFLTIELKLPEPINKLNFFDFLKNLDINNIINIIDPSLLIDSENTEEDKISCFSYVLYMICYI
jgi:hypothetical protein